MVHYFVMIPDFDENGFGYNSRRRTLIRGVEVVLTMSMTITLPRVPA